MEKKETRREKKLRQKREKEERKAEKARQKKEAKKRKQAKKKAKKASKKKSKKTQTNQVTPGGVEIANVTPGNDAVVYSKNEDTALLPESQEMAGLSIDDPQQKAEGEVEGEGDQDAYLEVEDETAEPSVPKSSKHGCGKRMCRCVWRCMTLQMIFGKKDQMQNFAENEKKSLNERDGIERDEAKHVSFKKEEDADEKATEVML